MEDRLFVTDTTVPLKSFARPIAFPRIQSSGLKREAGIEHSAGLTVSVHRLVSAAIVWRIATMRPASRIYLITFQVIVFNAAAEVCGLELQTHDVSHL